MRWVLPEPATAMTARFSADGIPYVARDSDGMLGLEECQRASGLILGHPGDEPLVVGIGSGEDGVQRLSSIRMDKLRLQCLAAICATDMDADVICVDVG